MGCAPDDLWAMAETLRTLAKSKGDTHPVYSRAAISRAYYSCYHEVRAYIHETGGENVSAKIKDAHQEVWNRFENRTHQKIYEGGHGCRGHRNTADYSLHQPFKVEQMDIIWPVFESLRVNLKSLRSKVQNPIPITYP